MNEMLPRGREVIEAMSINSLCNKNVRKKKKRKEKKLCFGNINKN